MWALARWAQCHSQLLLQILSDIESSGEKRQCCGCSHALLNIVSGEIYLVWALFTQYLWCPFIPTLNITQTRAECPRTGWVCSFCLLTKVAAQCCPAAQRELLWMALKYFPCTALGEEWFPSMEEHGIWTQCSWWISSNSGYSDSIEDVTSVGRSEDQWCVYSGEEALQKHGLGNSGRTCTETHGRVAQTPWPYGLHPGLDGVSHQVLESRGALGLVPTCTMEAASQGARAPCKVALGWPGMSWVPSFGVLSTNIHPLARK